jgi:hypothetical protein
MPKINRRFAATCAAAAVAVGALATPGMGSAGKSYKVKFTLVGKLSGTNTVKGKVTADPWGKGRYVSKVDFPTATYTLKFKKGKIKFKEHGKLEGTIGKSTWKITGGTGKFKGISGRGTGGGDIRGNTFKYKGRASR